MKLRLLFLISIPFLLIASFGFAPKKKSTGKEKPQSANETSDKRFYGGMRWRNIGPFRGGRSLTVSGVIGNPMIYYEGATGGGVWKTVDGGITWFPVSDSGFHSSSVGALAVAPGDPNTIYVGMGEAAIRNTAIMGDGIYKSVDAGKSWKHVLTLDESAIGRIIVSPHNPDVAYAAVMGKMFGANKERGVYRTKDGGKTWQQVLSKNDSTGAIDVKFDPTNPNILYASLWQVHRTPWIMSDGGLGSGLYKSIDGGDTWTLLSQNPGMPKGLLGKITVTLSADNPRRVYAMVENKHGGLFRSEDGGRTWELASDKNDLTQRPWYFSEIFADPKNQNIIYVLNVEYWRSVDGGKTFSKIKQEHGDNHDMWINPNNPDNFILADDGSAAVTFNGGRTWSGERMPTGQFYHVNLDNDFPYNAYGAQQDWGPVRIATRTYHDNIDVPDWYTPAGGEAGYIVPDPLEPSVTYGGDYDGLMIRHDKKNEQYQIVSVYPEINDGYGSGVNKYRFQWTYPIAFSPFDPHTIYCTSQYVHRSHDGGMSWETISPDLTRNDKTKQQQSGGPVTPDNTGAEVYGDIFAFDESSVEKGLLWAGSDDGLVHVSHNGGGTWADVTPKGLPEWATISIIEPSRFDSSECFVAAHNYRQGDTRPYIYRSNDFGRTWTLIVNGLPNNSSTRCVREDPNKKGLLYAGTQTGAYVSLDNGDHWQSLRLNLPITPVHDIRVQKDQQDLVIATHGRGFWVLDDLTPLYQLSDSVKQSDYWLFNPRNAIRMDGSQADTSADEQEKLMAGTNAPNGVIIDYVLKHKPKGEIKLEFFTANGDSIITFSNRNDKLGVPLKEKKEYFENPKHKPNVLPTDSGMNRFVWDMYWPDARHFDDDWVNNGSLQGPRAVPGVYIVKLYKGDTLLMKRNFKIVENPKVHSTLDDLKGQYDLMMKLNKKENDVTSAVVEIRSVRNQVNQFVNSFSDTTKIKSLKAVAKPLLDSLEKIEDTLIQVKVKAGEDVLRYPMQMLERICALHDLIGSSDSKPTSQEGVVFEELAARTDAHLKRLQSVFAKQVPAFNDTASQLKLSIVDPGRAIKK